MGGGPLWARAAGAFVYKIHASTIKCAIVKVNAKESTMIQMGDREGGGGIKILKYDRIRAERTFVLSINLCKFHTANIVLIIQDAV